MPPSTKHQTTRLRWMLFFTLLCLVGFIVFSTIQTAERSYQKIAQEQGLYIEELHREVKEIEGKINATDLLMLPIYKDHVLSVEEKIEVIESLRSLEGSVSSLSRLADHYEDSRSRYLFANGNERMTDEFLSSHQAVLHTRRLVRTIDHLLLERLINYEQKEVLVEHFNTARWSLQLITSDTP